MPDIDQVQPTRGWRSVADRGSRGV